MEKKVDKLILVKYIEISDDESEHNKKCFQYGITVSVFVVF